MYNNPYGPRKPAPPPKLDDLEARFNALPAWGRYGLTGCVAIFFIATLAWMVVLLGGAFPSPQQPVSASAQVPSPAAMKPTDTPTSTATSTPEPAQPPAQQSQQSQPASTALSIAITNAFAYDYGPGSVSVHTLPNAALTISVKYCTGSYADSKSLKGTVYADSDGNYTWLWEPETKCKGAATAYVNASLNGQSVSTSTTFTVS